MTAAERFQFDLAGFLVRPAILTPAQVVARLNPVDAPRVFPNIRKSQESLNTTDDGDDLGHLC
jgi:hypothetical protein